MRAAAAPRKPKKGAVSSPLKVVMVDCFFFFFLFAGRYGDGLTEWWIARLGDHRERG